MSRQGYPKPAIFGLRKLRTRMVSPESPIRQWLLTMLLPGCLGILMVACRENQPDPSAGFNGLLTRAEALARRHTELTFRIDSLWDATTARLAEAMPPDFPVVDRAIFLESRNADHMRMFMSFDLLDSATRERIHAAGRADQQLALDLRRWAVEYRAFEQEKEAFLNTVSQFPDSIQHQWAQRIKDIPRPSVPDTH